MDLSNKLQQRHVDCQSGLISQSEYISSPNHNERPANTVIDLLVIHGISLPPGEFGNHWVQAFFTNQLDPDFHDYFKKIAHLKVSSHLFIDRVGKIWQFVPFHKRAWHAGSSSFKGKENCNDFSIGIELEGTDVLPYTSSQYQALAEATVAIIEAYPSITVERIVGHSEIAPNRKTDPGELFDWQYYRDRILHLL